MKTIGTIEHTKTSHFQQAVFLNDASLAYEILDGILGVGHEDEPWYPENAQSEWTDIAVLDGKYYAVYGEDSVMTQNADCTYIQIEPTKSMIKEYEYYKQY